MLVLSGQFQRLNFLKQNRPRPKFRVNLSASPKIRKGTAVVLTAYNKNYAAIAISMTSTTTRELSL